MRAGFWEILLIVVLVLILFGHSKIPDLMKNLANGINIFKKELKTEKVDKSVPATEPTPVKKIAPAKKTTAKKPVKKVAAVKAKAKPVAKKAPAKKK